MPELAIKKSVTGIPGFDLISYGGLPNGRTTLVSGTAGSAKTVFAAQFLVEGIKQYNENGVFVTFEESPDDIRRNMLGLGWNIEEFERDNKWVFVDGTRGPGGTSIKSGDFDLTALMARIEHAVSKVKARRVSLDSLGSLFVQFNDDAIIRNELYKVAFGLTKLGVTSVLTGERNEEYGDISRYGMEEFVADNVVILRNVLEKEKRRRTVEILKFRGTSHQKGEFPFTVMPSQGIVVIPLSAIELKQHSSDVRVSSGNDELDKMCGGGFFRDSIILVTGATGTGKTLNVMQFLDAGREMKEKSLLFAFEESRLQILRNASNWGLNFDNMEKNGLLKIVCEYPEAMSLEDHLIRIKELIEEFKPARIAIDSLSALERVSTPRGFREFVISVTSYIKHKEIIGLCTATTPTLTGGTSVTEEHVSTITDTIVILRYVEALGELRRGLAVLKMRGSMHDREIREYSIDGSGMHIGRSFKNISGIISGNLRHVAQTEVDRLGQLFEPNE